MIGVLPKSRGIVGRRDLLAAIMSNDQEMIESICESLGLESQRPVVHVEKVVAVGSAEMHLQNFVPHIADHAYPSKIEPIAIWVQTHFQPRASQESQEDDKVYHRWEAGSTASPPTHRPIASWSELSPRLRETLDDIRPRKQLDLAKILTRVAKREHLERLPVLYGRSWGRRVVVVKDTNPYLTTFEPDQDLVIESLRNMFAPEQWSEVHGPRPNLLWYRDPATGKPLTIPRRFESPNRPASVFVLGDLGCLSPYRRARTEWLRWGERLRGLGYRLHALIPGSLQEIPVPLANVFSVQTWQTSRSLIRDRDRRRRLLDQLFVFAAPALLVEPGLLRDLRLLVPGAVDATLEIDFWLSDRLSNRHPSGAMIDRGLVEEELMPRFVQLPAHAQKRVLETIRNWRRNRANAPELWFEEVLSLPVELRRWVSYDLANARASVRELERRWRSGDQDAEAIETWFYNQTRRLPASAFEDSVVGERLRHVYRELHEPTEECLPGTDPRELPSGELRDYRIHVDDKTIEITSNSDRANEPIRVFGTIQSGNGVFSCFARQEPFWRGRKPDYVSDFGTDQFGAWFEFELSADDGVVATQRMRWVPAGEFLMGSPDTEAERYDDEGPQHQVTLSKGFWIADTPCTQALWQAVLGQNPSSHKGQELPVECVSWNDVRQFCEQLNERIPGLGMRLPTEAQWEYACRAVTTTRYWWGDDFDGSSANVGRQVGKTTVVKAFAANPFGLFDVHGNVWEWCADFWQEYRSEHETDPEGPEKGSGRVIRGGSWLDSAGHARSAYRGRYDPASRGHDLGFRCLSSVTAEPSEAAVLPVAEQGTQTAHLGGAEKIVRAKTIKVVGEKTAKVESFRGTRIGIRTDAEEYWFERLTFPEWATAFGHDSFGVYADLQILGDDSTSICQRLRWIPPGRFRMGSPTNESGRVDTETEHDVTITDAFWLFETPCTQRIWEAVMGENPSHFSDPNRPVEQVDWAQANEFADALTSMIGHADLNFSLPTEAQWEYACRAGTTTPIYSGSLKILGSANAPGLDAIAWYGGNSGHEYDHEKSVDIRKYEWLSNKQYEFDAAGTRKVKQKRPNQWGLYDMLGNVWEWCLDRWGEYDHDSQVDPKGPKVGSDRVIRGGGWIYDARHARSASRNRHDPASRNNDLGFRCLSSVKPIAEQVSAARSEPRDEAAEQRRTQ